MTNPQSGEMSTFTIHRGADATGISGTGRVLDGVIFHTGQVVVCWRSQHGSITIFEHWDAFASVHLKTHPENKTNIVFLSGAAPDDVS